ncbi:MAG: methionyl-tRNA formyltransferase [Planctomycetes bacterium]|nr:methionyl-tRNA formyltransferase [Planctomycetota bacterium]
MRLVFLGSPPFAVPVLERVLASSHVVAALVTPPDKPKGRGMKVEPSPLRALADPRSIPVVQPTTTKDPAFVETLSALQPDVLLVASYGEILRQDALSLAPHGALNVHASLLPRWRGASPIQAAILAGDRETGVCVQRMVLALDEGDVLVERRTEIDEHENAGELLQRLALLGGEVAVEALDALEHGTARFTPQDPALATFARKIPKERGWIDWTKSALELDRHVRAFTPWPGARTTLDGQDLTLIEARVRNDVEAVERTAGSVFATKHELFVACGTGTLQVLRLKPAGKGVLATDAWLRGARLAPDARLGA